MTNPTPKDDNPTAARVTVVQPSLAKYRIPVFRELAARPGIDLHVVYATRGDLANVAAEGFRATHSKLRIIGSGSKKILWHTAQVSWGSKRQTDVLILNWSSRYASIIPALIRAKMSGVKTVIWGHGFSKNESDRRRAARRKIAAMADALLFYDRVTAEEFAEENSCAEKTFVAQNTIDGREVARSRSRWEQDPDGLRVFREEHGLEPGPVTIYVSRLDPANRVDMLIEAAARLQEDWPDHRTVIIGNGDEERTRLTALAAELGLSDEVHLMPGIYNEDDLARWFLSAGVFCYPENIGLSIIHAMRYGLPVVTSDRRGCHNPEIVALRPGETGLTYSHGDVASLTDTLRRLHSDQEARDVMGAAGRRVADEEFTLPKMVDGFEAAIRYCLNGKSG